MEFDGIVGIRCCASMVGRTEPREHDTRHTEQHLMDTSSRKTALGPEARIPRSRDYGLYLVAFVDLLGQQDSIPTGSDATESDPFPDIRHLLERNARQVVALREGFATFFAVSATENESTIANESEIVKKLHRQFVSRRVHQAGFSDSVLLAKPLVRHKLFGNATNIEAIKSMLYALGALSLTMLARGVPIRGGVEVERGMRLYGREVHGPALHSAYRLESSVAEYPRIVAGGGITRYLSAIEDQKYTGALKLLVERELKACRDLLCLAPDDGQLMVDMLSPLLGRAPTFESEVRHARDWIEQEISRFELERRDLLLRRYRRLLLYFRSKMDQPDSPGPGPKV